MINQLDNNFQKNKATFKAKFGKEWNAEPLLYIEYLQFLYMDALMNIDNVGLSQIRNEQNETNAYLKQIRDGQQETNTLLKKLIDR